MKLQEQFGLRGLSGTASPILHGSLANCGQMVPQPEAENSLSTIVTDWKTRGKVDVTRERTEQGSQLWRQDVLSTES